YAGILTRHRLEELTRGGASTPPETTKTMAPTGAVAAHFVEVHVDADLGAVRVTRIVAGSEGGRSLTQKTARTQSRRGLAGGIWVAVLEENVSDHAGHRTHCQRVLRRLSGGGQRRRARHRRRVRRRSGSDDGDWREGHRRARDHRDGCGHRERGLPRHRLSG